MSMSLHAQVRSQQRSIPPLIIDWLVEYGEEDFDGRGGIRRYFNKESRRKLEQAFGRRPVRRLGELLNSYLVESVDTGIIVTVGHRIGKCGRR